MSKMHLVIYDVLWLLLSKSADQIWLGSSEDPSWLVLEKDTFLDEPINVILQDMQILVELRDVELEPQDLNSKECHLDEVAKTHRLQPHSEGKTMRSNILTKISLVV